MKQGNFGLIVGHGPLDLVRNKTREEERVLSDTRHACKFCHSPRCSGSGGFILV